MTLTPRQRMLSAYQGQPPDRTPVAPEFWYYVPARLMGLTMVDFQRQVPHWQALQLTFKHYDCDGWGIVAPGAPDWGGEERARVARLDERRYEETATIAHEGRSLTSRTLYDVEEPSWLVERYVKDWEADWPVYERYAMPPVASLDWRPVREALDAVGEDYLLEVFVGFPFVDFVGGQREGGLEQVVVDLVERQDEMRMLLKRYLAHIAEKTRAAFACTPARSVFVASSWSSLSLLSPSLWRRWEKPVLEAVAEAAHACGGLVHHHFHGRCLGVLEELGALGLDCICPFERPPGGDVVDLRRVRRALGERTAFNGNVHTVETLLRGTPEDARREVGEIRAAFEGSNRLIVGTGDQVGGDTPEENIQAMIEAARR
jgi:uroporphyrinogen-III decarboxylase